jgi:N-acetylmuramoyl-L-alanine amidase
LIGLRTKSLFIIATVFSASSLIAQTSSRVARAAPLKLISVENIRYWEASNSVRVVVDVGGSVKFKQGEARSPDRVFVDISPAHLNHELVGKDWPVESGLLQKIRVGQYDPSTVRVVLDLGTMRKVTSFLLTDPNRLIIDALGDPPAAPPVLAAPSPVSPPATAAAPPKKEVPTTEIKAPAPKPADEPKLVVTPAKPTNRGNQSLVRSLGLKVSRVVIDAGHGGHDTGSIGPTGLAEKDLVLDVAKRLKFLIESELGSEVVMTREDDTFIPLEARTAIANQQEADLFISIHANSSKTRTVRGVETYFLGLTTARDALETAARENAASERSIHDLQDVVKKIMTQDKVDESRELARHIQNAMSRPQDGANRGVRQAHFVVLIGANMPSVLAEINFITNPQEERLLKTPKGRQQIADSLLTGVKSYSNTLSGLKTAKSQGK